MRTGRRTTTLTLALPLAIALGLAGCSSGSDEGTAPPQAGPPTAGAPTTAGGETTAAGDVEAMLTKYELTGKDVRTIIDELDRTHDDREAGLMGSVRTDELVLRDDSGEVRMPMPTDLTYVSFAPYVNQTHDCFNHSLATCQGEMVDTPVTLKVTDSSGELVAEEEATTYENGFVGLWLPRDVNGQIEITADGRTATAPLSTANDAPTCVTTIKVS